MGAVQIAEENEAMFTDVNHLSDAESFIFIMVAGTKSKQLELAQRRNGSNEIPRFVPRSRELRQPFFTPRRCSWINHKHHILLSALPCHPRKLSGLFLLT